MRAAGVVAVLVLVVVLVCVVVETRPPRIRRGLKICSARDVKFMATFVCNLHRRSVRSVVQEEEEEEEDDGDSDDGDMGSPLDFKAIEWLAMMNPSQAYLQHWCGHSGVPCNPQRSFQRQQQAAPEDQQLDLRHRITPYVFNDWLSQIGYSTNTSPNSWRRSEENDEMDDDALANTNTKSPLTVPAQNAFRLKVSKRDKEVDWPSMVPSTLGDIRKSCCVRECSAEDFYGACV